MANDIFVGGSQIDDLKLGSSQVDKVYQGATEVWSAEPPPPIDPPNNLANFPLGAMTLDAFTPGGGAGESLNAGIYKCLTGASLDGNIRNGAATGQGNVRLTISTGLSTVTANAYIGTNLTGTLLGTLPPNTTRQTFDFNAADFFRIYSPTISQDIFITELFIGNI